LAELTALVLAVFFDVLFAPGGRVLGLENADLGLMFLHWRQFGFEELARGNLALWNPHVYGGIPFFGGMQSALLYPPNLLYLALPAPLAANWSIALNVWLLGAFMYLWTARRGLHPFAAFVGAALAMFCAPHFLRLYAGHITAMAAMSWTPLVFLALDGWIESRRPRWLLLGAFAVAMQIFAGHPQTVYVTGLAVGLYCLLRKEVVGVTAIYLGGAALGAVQLLAGFEATAETMRDRPLTRELAAYFSFPPESFVTLLAPGFFGDVAHHPYWGRWYLWEASAFIGVLGLVLAVYGIFRANPAGKRALLVTAGVALLLALGDNTPLYGLLFDWLPWYGRFRGAGKFVFVTLLIGALFAAGGLDRMLRSRAMPRAAVWGATGAAAAAGAAAIVLQSVDWKPLAGAVLASGQTYLEHARYADGAFLSASRGFAALGLMLGAATLALAAGLLAWTRKQARAALVLGALAVAEVFAFARLNRPTFDSSLTVFPRLAEFLASNPGDYRILNLARPNAAASMRAYDAWGYDPYVMRRYAEFVAWTTNEPEKNLPHVIFRQFHPLLAMLRVKYVVVIENGLMAIHPGGTPPLGRLVLVGSYQVRSGREAVLGAMAAREFDPAKQVILEREPRPAPEPGAARGRARILREGSDFMEIEAELERPSVLLVTDAWAPAWRAVPLDAGDARRYEVMPANYALRGIPLEAGKHRLRLEYAPEAFRIGALISALAWLAWAACAGVLWRRGGLLARD
jgi:hypothetical protein